MQKYDTIPYDPVLYYTRLHYTLLRDLRDCTGSPAWSVPASHTTLYYTTLYYHILCYTLLCFALLYSTLLYSAILYYTTSLSAGFAGCSPGRLPGTQRPKTKGSPLWLQAAAGLLPWGATPRGAAQP